MLNAASATQVPKVKIQPLHPTPIADYRNLPVGGYRVVARDRDTHVFLLRQHETGNYYLVEWSENNHMVVSFRVRPDGEVDT